jgi:ribosomal-protein-alanine N-acetyltransferase
LHEGKGLATALMAEARGEAEQAGARGLVLEVRPSNRRALRLYRHLGYDVVARRPRYYADGEDALVMTLQTGPPRDG